MDAPLDTESNVAWVGYANQKLQALIEPVLNDLLARFGLIGDELILSSHIDRLRRLPQHHDQTLRITLRSPARRFTSPGAGPARRHGRHRRLQRLARPGNADRRSCVRRSTTSPTVTSSSLACDTSAGPNATRDHHHRPRLDQTAERRLRQARQFFAGNPSPPGPPMSSGPCWFYCAKHERNSTGGLRILIDSQVPEGKGVSSSAAIEVATMRAVAALLKTELPGEELARLCQLAENQIVGAPCGIMDQMTSALGRENELLALRCQPAHDRRLRADSRTKLRFGASIREFATRSAVPTTLPSAAAPLWAIELSPKLPGYRDAGAATNHPAVVEINDPMWQRILGQHTPRTIPTTRFAEYGSRCKYPVAIFSIVIGGTTDRVTRIDPPALTPSASPTLHPIEENTRAERFRSLLQNPVNDESLAEMGQLMAAAHDSYTACGLSFRRPPTYSSNWSAKPAPRAASTAQKSPAVAAAAPSPSSAAPTPTPPSSASPEQYSELTGRQSYVFRGSSPGLTAHRSRKS